MPIGDTFSFDLPAATLTADPVEQTLDHVPAGEWHIWLNIRASWTDPASDGTACSANVAIDLDATDDSSWDSGINLRYQSNYPSHNAMARTVDCIEQSVVTIPIGGRDLALHKSGDGPVSGSFPTIVSGRIVGQKVSVL